MFPPSSFRQSHAYEPGKKPHPPPSFHPPQGRSRVQGSAKERSSFQAAAGIGCRGFHSGEEEKGGGGSPSQKQPPELPCGEKEGFRPSCRVRGRGNIYLFLRGKGDLKHGE